MSQQSQTAQRKPPRGKSKKRRTYSLDFKRQAIERMKACTSVTALAQELGIRRKWLYKWKHEFQEKKSSEGSSARTKSQDRCDKKISKLQKRIADLEQLSGRQALEIDFFRSALRRVEKSRQGTEISGGRASTVKSAAGCRRKAG